MMQAYDSVVLKADIEFGGTDQRFNMLAGRELQKKIGQSPQVVITTKLLVGTDGKEKMSKSLGNYIGITEGTKEQFGKVMSIPDSLIEQYFELCTDVGEQAIATMIKEMKAGKNPRDYKIKLAKEIVTIYHGVDEAVYAEEQFINQFQKHEMPDEMTGVKLSGNYQLTLLLTEIGAAGSNSDAKRLIEQGGVKIDGAKILDANAQVSTHSGMVIQVGKRKFWRVK
jgi:tyrosyl-tRNA synthetase